MNVELCFVADQIVVTEEITPQEVEHITVAKHQTLQKRLTATMIQNFRC
jgi:hypothetical protein